MLGVLHQKTAKFILKISFEYNNKYRICNLVKIIRHHAYSDYYLNSYIKFNLKLSNKI